MNSLDKKIQNKKTRKSIGLLINILIFYIDFAMTDANVAQIGFTERVTALLEAIDERLRHLEKLKEII